MDMEQRLGDLVRDFGRWWEPGTGFSEPKMTNELYPYTEMFKPVRVNSLVLKNRLVMAPMGNINLCDETGRPNAKMLKYFEARAKGGVGLITTGLIPVSYGIDTTLIELGQLTYFPRIDRSRTVFSPWRDLAAMCHAHGARIFIQLSAGMGRVGNPQCLLTQLKFPRSASFNPNWYMKEVPCLRLSDRSLTEIIKRVGQGAADAKSCNLDGVYLHGHEGYLLEQVANSAFNRRKFGKYADCERFGIDMVKEIRRRVGPDYPIMYRIDISLALNATYGERMNTVSPLKKFRKERAAEQTLSYMRRLVEAGVDMFDTDIGCYDNWWLPHPPAGMPAGCYLEISEYAKKYFEAEGIKSNKGLPVPIVAVGKLGYPDLAERALRDNKCDLVMLGRPLLADAEWCNKAYRGAVADIRPCIGCQEGCLNEFVEGGHPQCAVNPLTAFEDEYPAEILLARTKKRVAVIGAGPAGVVAAKTLIARGHSVDLYEKNAIGGNISPGSAPRMKFDLKNYREFLARETEKLKNSDRFRLVCEEADAPSLEAAGYDAIVVAAGATPIVPPVKGIRGSNVLSAIDALRDPSAVSDAKSVVVVGGGDVGCETAFYLACELKKRVTLIEMDKYLMRSVCTANRGYIIHYLDEAGATLLNCARLIEVTETGVRVARNTHKNVPDPRITWSPVLPSNVVNPLDALKKIKDVVEECEIPADKVILACGVKPNDELFRDLVARRAAPEIFNVGDSFKSGRVFEAVRAAYRKALSI